MTTPFGAHFFRHELDLLVELLRECRSHDVQVINAEDGTENRIKSIRRRTGLEAGCYAPLVPNATVAGLSEPRLPVKRNLLRTEVFAFVLSLCGLACDDVARFDESGTTATGMIESMRDQRYCEVVAGTIQGTDVVLDVYNTVGLGDCPQADWVLLDKLAISEQLGSDIVLLNGPRYWTLDGFERASLLDSMVVTFGTIPMRLGGRVTVPLSDAAKGGVPYVLRHVNRKTVARFDGMKRVHELVDPAEQVFVMQSYSVQLATQDYVSLESLAERLDLPMGWTYRTRVIPETVLVEAVNDLATVVQDDFANTYQLWISSP